MDEKMLKALNTQINKEFYSAYLYLAMSAYFEDNNLKGFACWMKVQAQEEMSHGMKIYNHIIERGGKVELFAIDLPKGVWNSPLEVFKASYDHEKKVTKMIHDLLALAVEINDYATIVFLHWFVTEQVEEEASALEIVEKLKLIDNNSPAILFLDAELGKRQTGQD